MCSNNAEEQISFIAKVFTLQKITITLQGNVNKMPAYFHKPYSYTTYNAGAKSAAIKTSGMEKIIVTIMLTELAGSMELSPYATQN
jgi:hypothetical protein